MKTAISTEKAPAAVGPYSQAIRCGGLVFISGQLPVDMQTGALCTGPVAEQTRHALNNAAAVALAAGTDLQNAVKTTIFLTDMNDFAQVNGAYADFFPDAPPARSCAVVAALPKGASIEIEVICAR